MTDSNLPNFENLSPEAQENIRNRVFRVFIESTFSDMQQERDRLQQDVFPRFKRQCKERDVEFVPIDLRWGVTEDQAQKGIIVGICLNEIRRSSPFFIGLLGKRYGWSPNKEEIAPSVFKHFPFLEEGVQNGLSITELSFQSVLLETTEMEAGFWIRSEQMETPDEYREKDADSIQKLARLKKKLCDQEKYPVADYRSPEDLGEQVERFLYERLDKYFPEKGKPSWLEKQDFEQGAFERSRKRLYVANQFDYERLNAFVISKEKTLAVVGASGLGKSALLANWKDACAKKFPNVKIVAHYVSASENSDLPTNILRRLTESLDPNFATEKEPQQDLTFQQRTLDDFSNEFAATVAQYLANNPEKRLLFVVDGLNQLSEVDDAKELRWLPDLPEGAQYLLSTVLTDHTFQTIKRKAWNRYEINVLDSARRRRIIEEYLKDRGKTLTVAQERKILEFTFTSNPFILTTLLEELCIFGVYEKLDAEIERYAQAKDVNDFFSKVFEQLESNKQFIETNPEKRKGIVEKLALLLALARFGLDEEELCRVADLEPIAVATFLCALDAQLVNRSGRYSYAHEHIRQAALKRYADKIVETRRLLIDKFLELTPEEERRLQEVPFQYLQLNSWEELRLFLLDFDVLKRLYNQTFDCDFCTYWNAASRVGKKEFKFASYLTLDSSDPSSWFILAHIAQAYTEFSTGEVAYQKTLESYRALAEENPKAYMPDVAQTLNNLANLHYSVNRLIEAEKEFQEALMIRRALAEENPKAYMPDVAQTLNNLAILYHSVNRLAEAEREYKEVLEIQRALAKETSRAYMPYVAQTLNNLANLHIDTNRLTEAEREYKEALEIRRALAKENPKAYAPDVAQTLNNLANLHYFTNRMDDAENEYKEALKIRRALAKENPITYTLYVAGTLNNLANLHKATNRMDDAEKEYKGALESYRALAMENPSAYAPNVAQTLNNLAYLHYSTNRMDDAEKEFKEALEIRRTLAKENPKAYMPNVAQTLNNLANLHSDTNRLDDAEKEYNEALKIQRALAKENLRAYVPDVAQTLNNLALLHSSTSRLDDAKNEYKEALKIRRALAEENPDAYKPILADTLFNMALFYRVSENFVNAKKFVSEAIAIYKDFAVFSPVYAERLKIARSLRKQISNHIKSKAEPVL